MNTDHTPHSSASVSPMQVIGVILAQGVIRLKERQNRLDTSAEERVSTDVSTPKENTRE